MISTRKNIDIHPKSYWCLPHINTMLSFMYPINYYALISFYECALANKNNKWNELWKWKHMIDDGNECKMKTQEVEMNNDKETFFYW